MLIYSSLQIMEVGVITIFIITIQGIIPQVNGELDWWIAQFKYTKFVYAKNL